MEERTYTMEELLLREQVVKEVIKEVRGNSQREMSDEEVDLARRRVDEIVEERYHS